MMAKKKAGPRGSSKTQIDAPSRDGWVRRYWGQERPSYEKLQEAMAVLHGDLPINPAMRFYIAEVLDWIYIRLDIEEDQHRRGRRDDWQMQFAAQIAIELVDRYDVLVKDAIGAMINSDADPKLFHRLTRTYSKLRKSGGYHLRPIERLIEEAAQRLPASAKRK